ncbi:MAG: hypothetical protein U0002_16390 [Thermoanaerobaculia bacterium]
MRRAFPEVEVLPWRDVLHEGPVPAGLTLGELRSVRARFLARQSWDELGALTADLADRDATLEDALEEDELVLWFEEDLYDQLQLLQVLDFCSQRERRPETTRVEAPVLGALEAEEARRLFAARRKVSSEELALAEAAWAAFRSPDPRDLLPFARLGEAPLPSLPAALARHLEELPDLETGLSRSERQALEALQAGASLVVEAFRAVHRAEEHAFLGDSVFATYLDRLASPPCPLLERADGAPWRRASEQDEAFFALEVRLTEAGREVLEGRLCWLDRQPIDRWLGGVHLRAGEPPWRWDRARREVVLATG